jgi:hypothetical protein
VVLQILILNVLFYFLFLILLVWDFYIVIQNFILFIFQSWSLEEERVIGKQENYKKIGGYPHSTN